MKSNGKFIVAAMLVSVLFLAFYPWYFALAVGMTAGALFSFIESSKKSLPILNFVFLIACLQWLLGPFLDYTFFNSHYRYKMYVEAEEYFSLLIPSLLAFGAGLGLLQSSVNLDWVKKYIEQKVEQQPNLPLTLVAIGFVSEYLAFAVPPSLRFVLYMVTTFKYIGLLYLLFSRSEKKWTTLIVVAGFSVANAIFLGLFHELLLWAAFVFIYFANYYQLTLKTKILAFTVGVSVAFVIQIVKSEYRQIIWSGSFAGSQTEAFTSVLNEQLGEAGTDGESNFHNAVIRLNQGWIISRIMYHVPFYEEHANGETITEAVYASLLPRFLNPSKKKAGGQENFTRFTGYELMSGTSMGTSVVGEAYANYGEDGTILFMFIYGLILAFVAQKIFTLSATKSPTLILWLPLIFLQVVKAETELVVVLNHLVKASIFVFGVYWISRKIFKVEL